MKELLIGIALGILFAHLYIVAGNDLSLWRLKDGIGMIGWGLRQKEFCKQYGKEAVISYSFDYGIITHGFCAK
mgnify:CR=1 FL=1